MRGLSIKGLVAIVLWGTSFVATRLVLESFHPVGLVAVRLALGTLLLVALIARRRPPRPARRDLTLSLALGAVLAVHLLLQSFGLLYTTATNTGWIIAFNPALIAIGAWVLGQQRLTRAAWLGVAVGGLGLFGVTSQALPDLQNARLGDLLQFLSCFTWTAYTLIAVGPVRRLGALSVTMWSGVAATFVVAVASLRTDLLVAEPSTVAIGAVAYLGLACSGLAYYLWVAAMQEHGPARLSALLYLEPLVTMAAAMAVLGEPMSSRAVAGGAVVLLGVYLVARGGRMPDELRGGWCSGIGARANRRGL